MIIMIGCSIGFNWIDWVQWVDWMKWLDMMDWIYWTDWMDWLDKMVWKNWDNTIGWIYQSRWFRWIGIIGWIDWTGCFGWIGRIGWKEGSAQYSSSQLYLNQTWWRICRVLILHPTDDNHDDDDDDDDTNHIKSMKQMAFPNFILNLQNCSFGPIMLMCTANVHVGKCSGQRHVSKKRLWYGLVLSDAQKLLYLSRKCDRFVWGKKCVFFFSSGQPENWSLFFVWTFVFFLENLICWGTRSVLISSDIYSPFASLFFCASWLYKYQGHFNLMSKKMKLRRRRVGFYLGRF